MCSFLKAVLLAGVLVANGPVLSQTLFTENFNNPASAAACFNVNGAASFAGGVLTLAPGNSVMLNSTTSTGDTGTAPVLYKVTQSFAPGSVLWPQYTEAEFRVRGNNSSLNDGYYLLTFYSSTGAEIALNRITDAEISHGILATTLVGGSSITPSPIYSLGPYELGLSLVNSPGAVDITVLINGAAAVTVHDTSPYRLVQGNSLGFLGEGTHSASWDDLSVTVVPEPSVCVLLLFALTIGHFGNRRAS